MINYVELAYSEKDFSRLISNQGLNGSWHNCLPPLSRGPKSAQVFVLLLEVWC